MFINWPFLCNITTLTHIAQTKKSIPHERIKFQSLYVTFNGLVGIFVRLP